jgi:putative membrane protein
MAEEARFTEGRGPLYVVVAVSAAAIAFLFWLIYFKPGTAGEASWTWILPPLNAALNAASALCLGLGVAAVRGGNRELHKKLLLAAFVFSSLFLVSYIAYYAFHGNTRFLAQGWIRPVYFFTLISHILLSIVALPMVLYTFTLAFLEKWKVHRAWARWTFPIWMYVSVTGVAVFAFQRLFNA